MKRTGLSAAALLLAALAAMKLFLPDLTAVVQRRALAAVPDETDYRAVFEQLGEFLASARRGAAEAAAPEPEETGTARPAYTAYRVEEAQALGETAPAEPAAVAVFLESQAEFSDYALPENVDYAYFPLPFDFAAPVAGYASSGFGYRHHPLLGGVRFHYGTDIAADAGEDVLAFADGEVSFAGTADGYGNYIILDHGAGWTTLYAHCSELCVETGQRVSAGERIALVGASGLATGPHLHFELHRDGVYRNPEYYINS